MPRLRAAGGGPLAGALLLVLWVLAPGSLPSPALRAAPQRRGGTSEMRTVARCVGPRFSVPTQML